MARIAKEHHARRQEFLNAARELFYLNGYEETSVSAILKKLDLAKGTFYHYFNSKEDLLDELVEHLTKDIVGMLGAFVDDPDIDAITKMNKIFESSGNYKAANKDIIMTVIRTMYSNKNLRMRLKMNARTIELMTPVMSKVIRQGMDEGVFDIEFPDEASTMLFSMLMGMGEKTADLILEIDEHPENAEAIIRYLEMYQHAMERFLGAPDGSIHFPIKDSLMTIIS